MDRLEDLLRPLLREGRVHFRTAPRLDPADTGALALLSATYEITCLEIAGPVIPFDGAVALEAARLVIHVCHALLSREQSVEELERRLSMSINPVTPSHHFSADLVFRYLPQVLLRARAVDPSDGLVVILTELLRRWPLSGVLANLDDAPRCPLEMGGHDGLLLLYAERWARRRNAAWRPGGRGAECVELVLRDLDGDRPQVVGTGNGRDAS